MKDDGGFAFPGQLTRMVTEFNQTFPHEETIYKQGMTMRQWYAGLAMQAMISAGQEGDIVGWAFKIADGMIEEEKK